MGSHGPTKAEIVLLEAKERLEIAKNKCEDLRAQALTAEAVFNAQLQSYHALERALARATPKRKSQAPAPKQPKDAKCDRCNETKGSVIHDIEGGYAAYHPFVSPTPAANAGSKSRSKKEKQPAPEAITKTEQEQNADGAAN